MTHCWHPVGESFSNMSGTSRREVCCHCGEYSYVLTKGKPVPGHGPHAPHFERTVDVGRYHRAWADSGMIYDDDPCGGRS